ncbi:ATP-binding cassette domain-containing protein, partial [Flaviflexus sp.]|uniref:ATP-binding cassette domain-containing protein n=1 Tax=Flaviflexus sp. TaxID=1969482 RepID=UPI003F9113E5
KTDGTITLHGKQVKISSPKDAVEAGIGYLSEDRKKYGLVMGQNVAQNTAMASIPHFTKGGVIDDSKIRRVAEKWVKRLGTKTPHVHQLIRNLSGGNMQKVVLAKWLERDCDVLIFDEPTRGIDVGAKQEIYDLLDQLTSEGKSIMMISSEMEEVLRLSDRIAVMCDGKITGFLLNEEATQEKIMELATQFSAVEENEEVA